MTTTSGSPARAGIDLNDVAFDPVEGGFPRTRGDRPTTIEDTAALAAVPPHARG